MPALSKPTNGSNADYANRIGLLFDAFNAGNSGAKNVVINGGFTVNQRVYASAAVLASGSYGHDRWKAGAGGGDYSFSQLSHNTQITIAANKTLIQVSDARDVVGGDYTLAWDGTCQARYAVNSATPAGSYASSPIAITGQTAGTVMSIEFGNGASAGTLGKVQLEGGTVATNFEKRPFSLELMLCQRFYQKSFPYATAPVQNFGYSNGGETTWGAGKAGALAEYSPRILFPVWMRAAPAIVTFNPVVANAQVRDFDAGADCSATATYAVSESGFSANCTGAAGTAVGNLLRFAWTAAAEL